MESDRPIQKSAEDRFGRWNFAQRVAQVIAGRNDSSSLVVGIHAPWGEGKTSVLNMIVEELNKHEHILVIHFNPWRFPDETQLLKGFFKALADVIDATLETRGEKLGEVAKKYAGLLAPVSLIGFNASDMVKSAGEISPAATLEQLKVRIENALKESGKRLVVVMDDIDRLDREEVQATFRLVKLSADFPNVAYILAFDDTRVAEALAEKYGSAEAGRAFLEKIVQVPLPLPPASLKARRALALDGIVSALKLADIELTSEQKNRFVDVFDKAFLHRIGTPRQAKRFANAMTFALPILRDEVETVDLILLEAIRAFYPKLYASIRENEEIFLGTVFDWAVNKSDVESRVSDTLEAALIGLNHQDNQAARLVIQELFPKTNASGLFSPDSYGGEYNAVWAREKRIASKHYFYRYFTYGVSPDDISDKEIEEFIHSIPAKDIDFVIARIKELASNERGDVLIEKLRAFEDSLPIDTAKPLAKGIAQSGDVLPQSHPTDRFFGLGASAQASAMLRHIIGSFTELSERESFALEIANVIQPLPFAFDYTRWMRPLKRDYYSEEKVAVVSTDCEHEINKRIALRIATEARSVALEEKYPLDVQGLYRFWAFHDKDSFRTYLESRCSEQPDSVAGFLVGYLGIDPSSTSDKPLHLMDEKSWYESLAAIIAPRTILSALKHSFPEIETQEFTEKFRGKQDARARVARWFAAMFRHMNEKP